MATTESSTPGAFGGDASAALVLEKMTSDPRYTRGQTLLKEKRLEEAVVVYEDLLRTMYVTSANMCCCRAIENRCLTDSILCIVGMA